MLYLFHAGKKPCINTNDNEKGIFKKKKKAAVSS